MVVSKPERTARLLQEQDVDVIAYKNGIRMPYFDIETDRISAMEHSVAYFDKTQRRMWDQRASNWSTSGVAIDPDMCFRPGSPVSEPWLAAYPKFY